MSRRPPSLGVACKQWLPGNWVSTRGQLGLHTANRAIAQPPKNCRCGCTAAVKNVNVPKQLEVAGQVGQEMTGA